MRLLYDLFLRLYKLGIWVASPFHDKAKKWLQGRRDVFKTLSKFAQEHPNNIWVHCASVGEFEQGLPIIQELEKAYPNYQILISFFSPSGYEFVSKKHPQLNTIYLPLDTKKNAENWTKTLKPKAVFFVKYEFWHHYFSALHVKDIPLFMVSTVFWKELFFFKRYGTFFRQALKKVTHFFVQDEESQQLLESIGISNTSVSGDARFDRVLQLKNEVYSNEKIERFIDKAPALVAGSVWDEDIPTLKKMIEVLPEHFKIIIVPHEIDHFPYHKFSYLTNEKLTDNQNLSSKILFVDTLGILSKVYRYAKLVYVGGGFGKGIHNILEPAVYNKPVLIGPNFQQFIEARKLSEIGLLHIVENQNSVKEATESSLGIKPDVLRLNKAFFAKNANVSEQIIVFIKKHGFLD